jgi:hypothetical protein
VPYFATRISEQGMISMRTTAEVQALVARIRARLPRR